MTGHRSPVAEAGPNASLRRMAPLPYFKRLLSSWSYAGTKGAGLPFVRREAVASGHHEMVFPYATYSPWLADAEFQRVHAVTSEHTLVDLWRCYELWQLVEQVKDVPGSLIEIGVWRGGTGALIAQRAAALGIDAPVYLCDTFTGVVKTTKVDTYYKDGQHDDTSADHVRGVLSRLGLTTAELLVGIFPEDTGARVQDDTFRLCHLDVDVEESARDILEWVWPRLSVGGVVVFDDYGFASCPGITRLVDEQRSVPGRLVVHNLNGHGILVKQVA
jgi:O-methyltransferase